MPQSYKLPCSSQLGLQVSSPKQVKIHQPLLFQPVSVHIEGQGRVDGGQKRCTPWQDLSNGRRPLIVERVAGRLQSATAGAIPLVMLCLYSKTCLRF